MTKRIKIITGKSPFPMVAEERHLFLANELLTEFNQPVFINGRYAHCDDLHLLNDVDHTTTNTIVVVNIPSTDMGLWIKALSKKNLTVNKKNEPLKKLHKPWVLLIADKLQLDPEMKISPLLNEIEFIHAPPVNLREGFRNWSLQRNKNPFSLKAQPA